MEPWCRTVVVTPPMPAVVVVVAAVIVDVFQGILTTPLPVLAGGRCQWYDDDISASIFMSSDSFVRFDLVQCRANASARGS